MRRRWALAWLQRHMRYGAALTPCAVALGCSLGGAGDGGELRGGEDALTQGIRRANAGSGGQQRVEPTIVGQDITTPLACGKVCANFLAQRWVEGGIQIGAQVALSPLTVHQGLPPPCSNAR